ncbi:hypothetical protein BV22DRAFT_1135329 [Leucogyrophana mollusca]|uniref:Uncharacterized protein n=1 Tax=Leucogyrophana mollusca TaxID=85980 RepID=A0ACB8AXD3_9AGAM|nr:hypothetical protein BV22DRAFT_1135329 [Leucogyrophana mollusca]
MIHRGLADIKEYIITFSKNAEPNVDCAELEKTDLKFSIKWQHCRAGLVAATDITAHNRYVAWMQSDVFRGQKRPDAPDLAGGHGILEASSPRSRTRTGTDVEATRNAPSTSALPVHMAQPSREGGNRVGGGAAHTPRRRAKGNGV